MIIDLNEFDKLKKFIFEEEEDINDKHPFLTEYCSQCIPEENTNNKCEYQKMCLRYPTISNREDYYNLVKDLFDTIEFMMKNKSK